EPVARTPQETRKRHSPRVSAVSSRALTTRRSTAPGSQSRVSESAVAPLTSSIAHSGRASRRLARLAASKSNATAPSGGIFAPRFRMSTAGEQEHLHHGAGRERLHHGAAGRLHFRSRLAHFHPRDSLDLLPQRVGGVREQLSVELLHLGGACRTLG